MLYISEVKMSIKGRLQRMKSDFSSLVSKTQVCFLLNYSADVIMLTKVRVSYIKYSYHVHSWIHNAMAVSATVTYTTAGKLSKNSLVCCALYITCAVL